MNQLANALKLNDYTILIMFLLPLPGYQQDKIFRDILLKSLSS